MIDKLTLNVWNARVIVASTFATGTDLTDLQQWHPLGREGNRYVFVRLPNVPGLYLKCYTPRGQRPHQVDNSRIPALRVGEVIMNPSAYSTFDAFRQSMEHVLNPSLYESGLPITRIDNAVDLQMPIETAVKGAYWRNRRTFETYHLESSTTTKEYVIGRHPHSLAVYDLAEKLQRRGEHVPCAPLSRFEIREFGDVVPACIRNLRSFDQLLIYAGQVVYRELRPFQNVEHHSLSLPPMPERYEPVMGSVVTRASAPHIRLFVRQRETWAEIQGMLRFAKYHEMKNTLSVPNSRYERYWLEMYDVVTNMEQHLIYGYVHYFRMADVNRLRDLPLQTWHQAS